VNVSPNPLPLELRLTEIGRIHSPFSQATGTPTQPHRVGRAAGGVILKMKNHITLTSK
jgi:tRNA (Thr-GGU) A37 N-methylase